MENKKRITF